MSVASQVWSCPPVAPGPPPVSTFLLSLMEDVAAAVSVVRTETQISVNAPYPPKSAFLSVSQ